MKVTREVITDLLPVYYSGEASPDTRQLVEAFFAQDPAFAELARQSPENPILPEAIEPTGAGDKEKETMLRIKRNLNWRSTLLGIALFCSLMPFAFMVRDGQGLVWLLLRDQPYLALGFGLLAALAWAGYIWTHIALSDR